MIPGPVSFVQSGMVPIGSRSLQFLGYDDVLQVSLGGNALSPVPLLRFTAPSNPNRIFPYRSDSLLDSIQFSTTPVPEPSTFALFAVGGMFGWFYWRRKRR